LFIKTNQNAIMLRVLYYIPSVSNMKIVSSLLHFLMPRSATEQKYFTYLELFCFHFMTLDARKLK